MIVKLWHIIIEHDLKDFILHFLRPFQLYFREKHPYQWTVGKLTLYLINCSDFGFYNAKTFFSIGKAHNL